MYIYNECKPYSSNAITIISLTLDSFFALSFLFLFSLALIPYILKIKIGFILLMKIDGNLSGLKTKEGTMTRIDEVKYQNY